MEQLEAERQQLEDQLASMGSRQHANKANVIIRLLSVHRQIEAMHLQDLVNLNEEFGEEDIYNRAKG